MVIIIIIIIISFILMMCLQCSLFCFGFFCDFFTIARMGIPITHTVYICLDIWVTLFMIRQPNDTHDDIYNDDYEFSTVYMFLISGSHLLFCLGMLVCYITFQLNKYTCHTVRSHYYSSIKY